MKHLKTFVAAVSVVLIAAALANDTEIARQDEELLTGIIKQAAVLHDEDSETKISPRRYITCDGSTWSCEDCNTRKLCVEFFWYTGITYYQCPTWAPYCNSSATWAWCQAAGSAGCTGNSSQAG